MTMTASRASRLAFVVLTTTLVFGLGVWAAYQLQPILVWSIVAVFLAVGLRGPVDRLQTFGAPRALAILAVYLLLATLVIIVAIVVEPPLAVQFKQLLSVLQQPGGVSAALDRIAGPVGLSGVIASMQTQLDAIPGQIAGSAGSLTSVTVATVSSGTAALSVAVLGFFFLHDGRELVQSFIGLLPEAQRPVARRIAEHSGRAISGYIRGNLAISAIAGASAFLGMALLGIPYAVPLAVLLAVIDLIPMVGVTLGAIPVVLAALSVSPVKALVILVYIIVYQQIESNVLNPLIYGRSDQLPGLLVFLAFLAGSLLFGILGALIAIPAANIIRVLIREWTASRAATKTRDLPDATKPSSAIPLVGDEPQALAPAARTS